jgi:addiction module RelB/DinJ family antitoxin
MSNVLLSIKTDEQTKQDLKAFATELGISSTAVVNMVLKQVLRDRRIVLSTDLKPTPYLEKIMREADDDSKNDRDITHTSSPEEALAHFDSLMNK